MSESLLVRAMRALRAAFGGPAETAVTGLDDAAIDEEAEELLPAIRAHLTAMARPSIALEVRIGEAVDPGPISSIGGSPSIRPGADWPLDPDGRPMVFLAQLAFADLPDLPGYPTSGLLSFFVEETNHFGLFRRPPESGFHVRFEARTDGLLRVEPPALPSTSPFGKALGSNGAPLIGTAASGLPSPDCNEFAAYLQEQTESRDVGVRDVLSEELFEWLGEERVAPHYVGGYPAFTQNDVREEGHAPHHDRVLLQLGWAGFGSVPDEWDVCWGDAGEATFMIAHADLEARRFEETRFSWDCA